MNQRFDLQKMTLTDFNPDEYQAAIKGNGQDNTTPMTARDTGTVQGNTVSKGRVTLRLSDLAQTEVKAPQTPHMERTEQPSPRTEPRTAHHEPTTARPATTATESRPQHIEPTTTDTKPRPTHGKPATVEADAMANEQPTQPIEPRPYPLPEEGVYIPPSPPTQPLGPNGEYPLPTGGSYPVGNGYLVVDEPTEATPRTEAGATLRVLAMRPKPKKAPAEPTDMIPMNLRVPLYIRDAFFKACNDRGTTPSIILRSFMKSYGGM